MQVPPGPPSPWRWAVGALSLRILGRRRGWTAWAGCLGPGGRVQQETPGRGSGGPAFGEPRPPRPFESAGVSGALVGPEAPVGAESGLCGLQVAPRRHLGCRNRASGSQHSSCVSEGPSGLTLLPAASSLLYSLCSRGRWAGAGCVPLGAGPGGSRLCSPVLLGRGAVRKLWCQPLPRACPAILEGSGFLSHVPGGILAPLASSRRPSRPPAGPGHLPGQETAPGLGEVSRGQKAKTCPPLEGHGLWGCRGPCQPPPPTSGCVLPSPRNRICQTPH